jgi:hypothetical protein
MSMDLLTVFTGAFSFGIFLIIHVITFRRLAPEQLLRSLLFIVVGVMALPLVLMGGLFVLKATDASWQAWVCSTFLAVAIDGLLCFVYVLCIFGPYETSVRMRLVREIARGQGKGITHEELLGQYSARTIVDIRLQRLLGSGDIVEKDGLYRCDRSSNFFFIFDNIAGILKKWIGQ